MSPMKLFTVEDIDEEAGSCNSSGSWSDPFGAPHDEPIQQAGPPVEAEAKVRSAIRAARVLRAPIRRQQLLDQIVESFSRTRMRPLGGIATWASSALGDCTIPLAGCAVGALAQDRGQAFVVRLGAGAGCIMAGFDAAYAGDVDGKCGCRRGRSCALYEVGVETFFALGERKQS